MSLHSTFPADITLGLNVGDPGGSITIPAADKTVLLIMAKETSPLTPAGYTIELDDGQGNTIAGNKIGPASYGAGESLEFSFVYWTPGQIANLANLTPTINYSDAISVGSREWCVFYLDVGAYRDFAYAQFDAGGNAQPMNAPGSVDSIADGFAVGMYLNASLNRDLDNTTPIGGSLDTLLWDGKTNASSIGLATGSSIPAGPWSIEFRADATSTVDQGVAGVLFDPIVVAPPADGIDDVDGDNQITDGQTTVAVNCTGLPAGADEVTIDGITQADFNRVSDSLCTFTAALGDLRLGTDYDLRVEANGELFDTIAIQFVSAFDGSVTLSVLNADPAVRLTASPALATGDQIEWEVTTGTGTVEVRNDASFRAQDTVSAFRCRCHDGTEWGPWSQQQIV